MGVPLRSADEGVGAEKSLSESTCSHTCLRPKRYNCVPVVGQRCPATGKVTEGRTSHASQTGVVHPHMGLRPK